MITIFFGIFSSICQDVSLQTLLMAIVVLVNLLFLMSFAKNYICIRYVSITESKKKNRLFEKLRFHVNRFFKKGLFFYYNQNNFKILDIEDLTEFRKKFISISRTDKNRKCENRLESPTMTGIFSQRPVFTDSEDLQKKVNDLSLKNKTLEIQNSNFIEKQKKLNILLMKTKEITFLKLKANNLKKKKGGAGNELNMMFPSKEKELKKWNLKNKEFIIDLCDISVTLTKPKSEEKDNDYFINNLFIPMHMKIKNRSIYDITIQKCEIDLKKSFSLKYFS